ncbi:spermidine/putrescine ABC transporter ATP-binding protein PotA [Desulforegula conservatrix]|uniref:spermidine/putrescine ABC transporter ATP-binding protein PotA n=1 Tax=Desulforegula conservatrix TaxID=153026 RepID=UPI000409B8AD|nr:spermidine/putrescine ABC transporter ATP-binding protein PotA [Desulforegula conservatrix]
MQKPVVSLKNITKTYDNTEMVLHDISLDIYPGEFLTLLGPSGCGKTTILRLIAGLESCESGDIYINGKRVNGIPANKRDVNTVFQSYALFPHMSVFQNIAFGLELKKIPKNEINEKVQAILELVKLDGLENRNIQQLSGGQQQRVAMARAIVNKPLILLLDEPMSALDYKLRRTMQIELKHLHRKLGITFIFVTHDQEEALTMSDRVLVMNQGKIEQSGTPKEIYENPANMFVAKFVGEINVFDGRVIGTKGDRMAVTAEDMTFDCPNTKSFTPNQKIKMLLRPEDIKVSRASIKPATPFWRGRVEELIYKGTTVDLVVNLESGHKINITEFFNEDSEDIYYTTGERVNLTWINGWEVILPDE